MLLFCDSFDHYATAGLSEKYVQSAEAMIVSPGRSGAGNCLQLPINQGGYVQQAFPSQSELIVGVAFKPSAYSGFAFIEFTEPDGLQGSLVLNTEGGVEYHVVIDGNDTIIASSEDNVIETGVFQYIEIAVVFSPTQGTVSAQLNGTTSLFNVSGQNTAPTGNNYAASVLLTSANNDNDALYSFDDFYICNGVAPNNTFFGNIEIQCLFPNGQGQFTQFAPMPMGDANWYCVSQSTPDGDSYYVYSVTPGSIDLYTIEALSGSPSAAYAAQIVASARKDDSYTRVLGIGFGNGSTYAFSLGASLTGGYLMATQPYDVNPVTEASWQVSDFTSGQIGIEVNE